VEVWTRRGLQRFLILFFIELSTRKVEIAGIASIANGLWMAQIGRKVTNAVDGILNGKRYLIHDRDLLFKAEFLSLVASGSMPCRFRISAIVLRAMSYPRLDHAPLDTAIPPAAVLFCHSNHQSLDLSGSARAPWFALATAIVFLRNQFAMPSQQGFGRDKGGNLRPGFSGSSALSVHT
jgi:hypothetical protein